MNAELCKASADHCRMHTTARADPSRRPFLPEWWLISTGGSTKLDSMYICCLSTFYRQIIHVRKRRHGWEVLGKLRTPKNRNPHQAVNFLSKHNSCSSNQGCPFATHFSLPQKQPLRIGGNSHHIPTYHSSVSKFGFPPRREQLRCTDSFELNCLPLKSCKHFLKFMHSICTIMS